MSLGSALREGSNALVARSIEGQATEGQTLSLLADRFPGETDATYAELYRRGLQAWQAGQQMQAWEQDFPVTRGQLPASGGLPRGYSVYVQVEVTDPDTEQSVFTSIKLDFSSIPDRDAFEAALQQAVFDSFGPDFGTPFEKYRIADPQVSGYTITAIELGHL